MKHAVSNKTTTFMFNSRWYLGARKSPYAIHLSLRNFPDVAFENSSSVRRIDNGPLSSFRGRLSSASSSHYPRGDRWCDVLAMVPAVVSQAPRHFRFSATQASCDCSFARQSVCSVISCDSGMYTTILPQKFPKGDVDHCHIPVLASHSIFHFFLSQAR